MPRTQTTRPPRRAPRPSPRAAPPPQRRRSGGRNVARNLLALIALLLLAGVVALFVVLATGETGDRTNVQEVVEQEVQDQADGIRDLIEDNTE